MTAPNRRQIAAALTVALCCVAMTAAWQARPDEVPRIPEPEAIPTRWQLDVEMAPLRLTSATDREGQIRAYFYVTYKVTNNTGSDLVFAPTFDLATDEGPSIRSGRDVPPEVTKQLVARLENPLLLDQIQILGLLLQGEENAKEGIAIWPADDLKVDEVRVFASGFSGENRTLEYPNPNGGQPIRIVLRKTLMQVYHTPGVLYPDDSRPFVPGESRWIMR